MFVRASPPTHLLSIVSNRLILRKLANSQSKIASSDNCNAKIPLKVKEEWGRGRVRGKGEGPRENWEKVLVLWICRGVGVDTRGLGPLGR